jgi:phosphoglycerate dehydrogenase-like enzyme
MTHRKKAIFLVDDCPVPLGTVYDDSAMRSLGERLDLLPGVQTKSGLTAEVERNAEVRVILTTWGMPALAESEVEAWLPGLEAVFYAGGSVQSFAAPLLACGVRVFSAWAANAVPVAEHAVAQILLAGKGFHQSLSRTKSDYRKSREYSEGFPGNYGTRVGILGAGRIGSLVIGLLARHDLELLVYDPFLTEQQAEEMNIRLAGLEEIFSTCQTVSNHLADKPATKGLLDASLFDRMLPNATFLNTGRGAQVVEEDLLRALRDAPGRTAILDVTWPEPPTDMARFRALDNVFLTPHIAGSMNQECRRMGTTMVEELERMLDGRPVRYEVTEDMLETMA